MHILVLPRRASFYLCDDLTVFLLVFHRKSWLRSDAHFTSRAESLQKVVQKSGPRRRDTRLRGR